MTQIYAKYSRQVLKDYGIDPYYGMENIHWAPNKGHSNGYKKKVAKDLWGVKSQGGTKDDIIQKLEDIASLLRQDAY
jgi:hypothetical protein